MNRDLVRLRCLGIAKSLTPFRSGNLRGGTRSYPLQNGFMIKVSGAEIPYATAVEGKWTNKRWKGKKNPNEGYFSKKIYSAIGQYFDEIGNAKNQTNLQGILRQANNNPARNQTFLNSLERS